MSPEELAAGIVYWLGEAARQQNGRQVEASDLQDIFATAIREAVLAEREACAALAHHAAETVDIGPGGDCSQGCPGIAEEIAAAIRSRT